jgi:hypothetical protein
MPLTREGARLAARFQAERRAMAKDAETRRRANPWRVAGWGMAVALLGLPLVAMQFTSEVVWTAGDFVFAGLMFGTVGLIFELTVRVSQNWAYRAAVVFAVAAAFLNVWVNGAVGMIGDEDNPYNLLFLGVNVVAVAGVILARFREHGMARAMAVATVAQVGVALGGLTMDLRGAVLAAMLGSLWALSAALFANAAREGVTSQA